MKKFETKHVIFEERKTLGSTPAKFDVLSADSKKPLGEMRWSGKRDQYVYIADHGTTYTADHLGEISDFLEVLTCEQTDYAHG